MPDEAMPTSIVKALVLAKQKIGGVGKHETPLSGQKFNFRGIDTVVNAVAPVFNEMGIVVTPYLKSSRSEFVTYGASGTKGFRTEVVCEYTFHYKDETITCCVAAEAIDSGDKSTAKAMSVAFRIALLQALTLPTDEPDPDNYDYNVDKTGKDKETGEEARPDVLNQLAAALKLTGMTGTEQKDYVNGVISLGDRKFSEMTEVEAQTVLTVLIARADQE